MTAQQLDFLIRFFDNHNLNPQSYDKIAKEKINILYDLLDKIKPIGDDEYKVLYFSVPRGTLEEYVKHYGFDEEDNVNYQDYVEYFNEDYPDEECWYKLASSKYKKYRMLTINSKVVLYADMDMEDNFENHTLQDILELLKDKAKEVLNKLEDGTYNSYINENFSYRNRFGVIKRKDYWNIYPDIKDEFLKEISQDEINYFVENASDKTNKRIKEMTSAKYFECVRLAYEAVGYEIGNLADKELYLKYADGRDEGLTKINEDSSLEFNNWYNDDKKFGGHPYEIIRGHSFARVNLNIGYDEDGYYLSLDGTIILRKSEIAKIFNILHKNNIPIRIYQADLLKTAFNGEDEIGIVPNYVIPIQCGGYFKEFKPTEFVHLEDKMFKYIKWESLDKVELI